MLRAHWQVCKLNQCVEAFFTALTGIEKKLPIPFHNFGF